MHRYIEAQCLSRLEVDDKLILRRRLHRHVCGLFAFEDAIDVTGRLAPHVDAIGPIGEQAAGGDEGAIEVARGQLVPRRKRDDQIAMKQRPPAVTIRLSLIQIMATDLLWLCCYRGGFNVSKNPLTSPEGRENREPLEVTIKIKIDRKNADALVRLLIKQRDEILSVSESVEYIPYTPMEWLKKAGF